MRCIKRMTRFVVLLTTGCAGMHTADKAASLALDQLVRYEADVNTKVRVENDYYDQVMENAVKRVNRLRESEHDVKLKALARGFAEKHRGSDADSMKGDIPELFEAAIKDWADREAAYEQLIARTQKTLSENRKKLEAEQEKLRQLKVKLRALSEPGTAADMLNLAIAFAKEAKVKYDDMKADTDRAATAADKATGDASK